MGEDLWKRVIDGARWAPSAYNAQPWAFSYDGNSLTLLSRRERWRPVVDPNNRETVISLGSMMESLRYLLGPVEEELLLSAPQDEPVARYHLDSKRSWEGELASRAAALAAPRSCRRAYRHEPLSRELLSSVGRLDEDRLTVLPKGSVECRRLISESLEAALAHARALEIYAELAEFVASPSRRERRPWGVDAPVAESQGLYGHPAARGPRTLGKGYRGATITATRDLLNQAPLLVALTSRSDEPRELLQVGALYQRLRLFAEDHGLVTHPVSVLPQMVEAGRVDLQHRHGDIQMVVRVGVPLERRKLPAGFREPVESLLRSPASLGRNVA